MTASEGYNPHDRNWIIGDDETRAWSSKTGGYVTDWDKDNVTRIASERELDDVLIVYGIMGPSRVSKTTKYNIIKSVQAQGFGEALEVVFSQYPKIRQEWDAAPFEIYSNNESVRLVLESIGVDVDAAMSWNNT